MQKPLATIRALKSWIFPVRPRLPPTSSGQGVCAIFTLFAGPRGSVMASPNAVLTSPRYPPSGMDYVPHAINAVARNVIRFFVMDVTVERHSIICPLLRAVIARH